MTSTRLHWPTERPVRTIIGFLGIALGAKVVHRVRYERSDAIPATGPAIIVANHLSTTETLAMARLVTGHHRFPHFLANSEVFTWPLVGRLLRAARQIPVFRGSARAADSLAAAAKEIDRDHVVCLYPEGHLSTTADLRPGPGKTGAARLALARPGVPVIPVGMWGPRPGLKHIWHRHTVRLIVGEPIDLSNWAGCQDAECYRAATEAIMARITALAEDARGARFEP
ncbi:MAG: lysophospholipid acyltransferase family protein [Nakamurella sp.]